MTKINIFWSDSPLLVTKSSKWQMMEYGSFLCYEILMTASAALPPLKSVGRQLHTANSPSYTVDIFSGRGASHQ